MKKRVNFSVWAVRGSVEIPQCAYMADNHLAPSDAVIRAIERKSRLVCCGATPQGIDMSTQSAHYSLTFGRPSKSGGYGVEGSCWIAVLSD